MLASLQISFYNANYSAALNISKQMLNSSNISDNERKNCYELALLVL